MPSNWDSTNWIKPDIAWQQHDHLCVVVTTEEDAHLLELLAMGCLQVQQLPYLNAQVTARFIESTSPLTAKLIKNCSTKSKLSSNRSNQEITYYLHGALFLPDNSSYAILASAIPPVSQQLLWFPSEARHVVVELWRDYQDRMTEWHRKTEQAKKGHESFVKTSAFDEATRDKLSYFPPLPDPPPPPSLDSLQPLLETGVMVPLAGKSRATHTRSVLKALTDTKLEPPRDGQYEALLCGKGKLACEALVTWRPRNSLTSYPEIRCAVQKILPKALKKPRCESVTPPVHQFQSYDPDEIVDVVGLDQILNNPIQHITDISFQFNDIAEKAETAREGMKRYGVEAIAWYQGYHVHSEATWGIYIPAEKIDKLACTFHEDLRNAGERSQALAMILALQLVYQHELFHARVEACLSWLELTNLSPRHLRYKENVYHTAQMTDDWLEEALANWGSFMWLKKELPRLEEMRLIRKPQAVERVVQANLDLSPPGYRNWRIGARRESWRAFSSELVSGKPAQAIANKVLPLDALLADPLPFDMVPDDIPIHILGRGTVVDTLLASPANFAVPARREIERALRYFGYNVDKRRGKGSHELWTGSDNRSFAIPCRDPLSRGVFSSFLHHFNLDKTTYVLEIRPQL